MSVNIKLLISVTQKIFQWYGIVLLRLGLPEQAMGWFIYLSGLGLIYIAEDKPTEFFMCVYLCVLLDHVEV